MLLHETKPLYIHVSWRSHKLVTHVLWRTTTMILWSDRSSRVLIHGFVSQARQYGRAEKKSLDLIHHRAGTLRPKTYSRKKTKLIVQKSYKKKRPDSRKRTYKFMQISPGSVDELLTGAAPPIPFFSSDYPPEIWNSFSIQLFISSFAAVIRGRRRWCFHYAFSQLF